MERIVITEMPLDTPPEGVWGMVQQDEDLVSAITEFSKDKEWEIFEQRGNIMATSEGFFCAFYEKDLMKI